MAQNKLVAPRNRIITPHLAIAPERYRVAGFILGFLGLGVLGAALYLVPKPATLGLIFLGLGVPVLLLGWYRPEYWLLALIFLTSSLVPADVVDLRLPIGGGLDLRDLVLMSMLGLLILRELSYKSLTIPWWPVGAPLVVFLGFALFSTFYAFFYQHVEANWVLSDLRALIYYSVFFVTSWAITHRRQLMVVLIGLFIIANLVTGVIILQQFLGANHPLLTAMSYSNWKMYEQIGGSGSHGIVRIMPPGAVLVFFLMIMSFCLMVFTSHNRNLRFIFALQFVYLNFGLVLTYTRALWIAVAIALGLILIVIFPTYKSHLMHYLMIGIPVLGLVIGLLYFESQKATENSAFVTASVERALSILTPEETLESNSLQWRVFETEEGLSSVLKHPFLGVGLGNTYREITILQGEASGWLTQDSLEAGKISRFTRFLHSSYLYVAVKMGLPAFASFLWFYIALLVSSMLLYRKLSEGQPRAIALAVLAGSVGLMFWSVFHQHFIQTESTAIIGLMAGLTASLHRNPDEQNNPQQSSSRMLVGLHS